MLIPRDEILFVFQLFNDSKIEYALMTNNNDELPDNLLSGKDIDILVSPLQIELLDSILQKNNYIQIPHPKGKSNGWGFSYGSIEHQKWKKQWVEYDLELDIQFQLMCSSLQPNIWIPLDRSINEDAFKLRTFNSTLSCYELDDETRLIYLIARCVFDKNTFNDIYIKEIEKRSGLLSDKSFQIKMKKVFFNYSERIIQLLCEKKYNDIIHDYITFKNY